jgi:tetratricopeptide (TPR) repeat protein
LIQKGYIREVRQDYADAGEHYAGARCLIAASGGGETDFYASATHSLAAMAMARERFDLAEPLFLEALEQRTRLLGEVDPNTARTLGGLAELMRLQGRLDEALGYAQRAQASLATAELLDWRRVRVLTNVGRVHRSRRDVPAATAIWTGLVNELTPVVSPDSPLLLEPLAELTDTAAQQGDLEQALGFAARLTPTLANLPATARRPAALLVLRAQWLIELNRLDEAEPLLTEALTCLPSLDPPDPELSERAKTLLQQCQGE